MIDKVKLVAWSYDLVGGEGEPEVLATADYNNGKITINLPSNVADKFLLFNVGTSSSLSVNNPNARGTEEISIRGYKGNKRVCSFYYEKEDETSGAEGFLFYVNSAFSITGTETDTDDKDITYLREHKYTYSINAKRGWNMFYYIEYEGITTPTENGIKKAYKSELTTTNPGGLKWSVYFGDYDDDREVTAGEELKINAQVENGNNYNNTKRVRANGDDYALAVGKYNNGGFTITIPNKVYLGYYSNNIENYFNDYDETLNISNRSAKVLGLNNIQGYSSNSGAWDYEDYVGNFICGKIESDAKIYTRYIFVDMAVNVTGTRSNYYGENNYNLNLKAGWNAIYITETSEDYDINCSYSTTPISGLKWYFGDDFNSYTKNLTNKGLSRKGKIFNNPYRIRR